VYTEPVCGVDGFWVFVCVVCGDYCVEMDVGSALEHDYDEGIVTTAASCVEAGEKTYTCMVCDALKTEIVEALGHDFSILAEHKDATCDVAGFDVFKCSRCAETDTIILSIIDHDWIIKEVVDPTCKDQGYTNFECSLCGETKIDVYTSVLEHVWDEGKVTVLSTSESEGVMTFTCSLCGETRTEIMPKLPLDNVVVNNVDLATEVIGDVVTLKPTQEQMVSILSAPSTNVVFDLRGHTSVELYVDVGCFNDVDKFITIKTADGEDGVSTKSLWNNSGKMRLITVNNGKINFKNL
jgi:hypothetical protein